MFCSLQRDRSPLHVAVENGRTHIINILITYGANVDIQDRVGIIRYMC